LVAPLAAILATPLLAFHDGGAASCDGCHVTHRSEDGVPVALENPEDWLLRGASPSDVCLSCHADRLGAVLAANTLAPPPERGAGNFVFLLEDNLNDAEDGLLNPIPGDAAGHNIVSPAYGLTADARYAQAPGGDFPASEMGCSSCHDPHGNRNFRLLYGEQEVIEGLFVFSQPAPEAEGISLTASVGESPDGHSAYLAGMSDWCSNCHGLYHEETGSEFEHESGHPLEDEYANQYNLYNGDDDPLGGLPSSSYLPEVPFEDPAVEITSRTGPTPASEVMCLSCHRAHATSAPHALRWDPNVVLLAQDGEVSGSYRIPEPYNKPSQGSLCAKCHQGGAPSDEFEPKDGFLDAFFGRQEH
jgi:predicted CXXCH cytochrome family protein